MIKTVLLLLIALFISVGANASDGIINVASHHSVSITADRLETILTKKGMTIFNRIKHSESAAKIGIKIRETELIIFGNPKAGSPLMKCQQKMAIDLPQKTLIWKDEHNKVWLSYNDIEYLKKRHSVKGCEKVLLKVSNILAKVTQSAANK